MNVHQPTHMDISNINGPWIWKQTSKKAALLSLAHPEIKPGVKHVIQIKIEWNVFMWYLGNISFRHEAYLKITANRKRVADREPSVFWHVKWLQREVCVCSAFSQLFRKIPRALMRLDATLPTALLTLNSTRLFNILLTPASKTAATVTPEIIIFYHSLFVLRHFPFLLQPDSSHSCGELFCINQPVEYWISFATGNVVLCAMCVWLINTTSWATKPRQKEPPSGRFCYWIRKTRFHTPRPCFSTVLTSTHGLHLPGPWRGIPTTVLMTRVYSFFCLSFFFLLSRGRTAWLTVDKVKSGCWTKEQRLH